MGGVDFDESAELVIDAVRHLFARSLTSVSHALVRVILVNKGAGYVPL